MKFGPFFGENNRRKAQELEVTERGRRAGDFLSASSNVLIDDVGRIEARAGYTQALPLTTGRALCTLAGKMLFADGTALKQASFSPLAATTVDTVAAHRIAYAESNGDIYYTDGTKLSCLESGGTVRPVGVPVPASLSVSAIAGSLPPGVYTAAITYLNGAEEGGARIAASITLAVTGGVRLTLPVAPAGVTHVAVYLTANGGYAPMLYVIGASASTTVDATSEATGRGLQTRNKAAMPAGDHLAFQDSRLLVAAGNTLYYSDPYNYGLTTPTRSYLQFPAPISVLISCVNGTYLVADQTYWLDNIGTDEMALPITLPYGAVAYSGGVVPNEKKVFWLSERGVVIGDEQGQVVNIQEEALLLKLEGEGAALFIEGANRIVATNG